MARRSLEDRRKRAYELHSAIGEAAKNFVESMLRIGAALKSIRDEKLYKELGHDTFEAYVESEWNMTTRHAYRYIEVIEKLPPQIVTRVSQLGSEAPSFRRLLALPSDKSFLENLTEEDLRELAEMSDAEFNGHKVSWHARYQKQYRRSEKLTEDNRTLKQEKQQLMDQIEQLNRDLFVLKSEEENEKILRLQQDRDNLLNKLTSLEDELNNRKSQELSEEQAFALIRKTLDQVIGMLIDLRQVKLFPAILPQMYGTYTVIRDMLDGEIAYLIDKFNPAEGPLVLKHLAEDVEKLQRGESFTSKEKEE